MKLEYETQHIERGDDNGEEHEFSIEATDTAFEVLSSGIYQDKEQAIVRELCCNAYDAHVMSGKVDEPIIVQLPTYLDPTFKVTDNGLGMSHEDVIHLYRTYFKSTKRSSNDVVGALGLGSKSPFSYASTFLVESRYNGVRRLYNAYKNEQRRPCISLMGEEETSEPNGMTITISVKREDVYKWTVAAERVFMSFPVHPTIISGRMAGYTQPSVIAMYSGNKWIVRSTASYPTVTGPRIIQGWVAYPIDLDVLTTYDIHSSHVCNLDLDIYADIGDVSVTASREGLSYTASTIKYVIDRLNAINEELYDAVQKSVNECATLWEATKYVWKLVQSPATASMHKMYNEMLDSRGFTWNGISVGRSQTISFSNIQHTDVYVYGLRRASKRPHVSTSRTVDNVIKTELEVVITESVEVIVDERGKGMSSRITKFMNDHKRADTPTSYVIVLRPHVVGSYVQSEVDNILAQLGGPTALKASDLPAPPSTTQVRTLSTSQRRSKGQTYAWSGFPRLTRRRRYSLSRTTVNRKFGRSCWAPTDVDWAAGGVYVPIDKFVAYHQSRPMYYIDDLIESAQQANVISSPVVYGLSAKEIANLPSGWSNLFDLITTFIAKETVMDSEWANHYAAEEVQSILSLCSYARVLLGGDVKAAWTNMHDTFKECLFTRYVDEMMDLYARYRQSNLVDITHIRTVDSLMNYMNIAKNVDSIARDRTKDVTDMEKQVLLQYPALTHILGENYQGKAATEVMLLTSLYVNHVTNTTQHMQQVEELQQ